MGDRKCILREVTLSTLRDWLNENRKKREGETRSDFTINDVKAYCDRGQLPRYLGGNRIEKVPSGGDPRVKVYNLIGNEE